jgi:hypothetical protein
MDSKVFTGNAPRNVNFCQWAQIGSTERLEGKVHTNDIWRLMDTDLSGVIDRGQISSSCPDAPPATWGCSPTHRYINASQGSSPTAPASWIASGSDKTTAPTSPLTWASGTDSVNPDINGPNKAKNRNPRWDSPLLLPESPSILKQAAAAMGCVYTGPTRILFGADASGPYMWVTSPDTLKTGRYCDGTLAGTSLAATSPTSQPSIKVPLAPFTDLVIYVQDVPTVGATDPLNPYVLSNNQPGAIPSCQAKTTAGAPSRTNTYPYVIPSDADDKALFTAAHTTYYMGFPSEDASTSSPWFKDGCALGDLYVQGQIKGNYTISTSGSVIITGDLYDSSSLMTPRPAVNASLSTTFGKPEMGSSSIPASPSNLGLVSDKFTFIYRPSTDNNGTAVSSWNTSNVNNVVINAAILVIQECFAAQDATLGAKQGYIYFYGSLAQHYRCAVGRVNTSGYSKAYRYDKRLAYRTPPYMLKLSDDPWRNGRVGEITPNAQTVNTAVTYPVLTAKEIASGLTVTLPDPPTYDPTRGTAQAVGTSSVSVTPTATGLFIASYYVHTPTFSTPAVRRLVVQVS